MSKKYLRKNEFRFDFNPEHLSSKGKPHPAFVSARFGHRYKANTITHSRRVDDNTFNENIDNPEINSKDKRQTRISPPFWQSDKLFSNYTLDGFRLTKESKKKIKKYNKKFK